MRYISIILRDTPWKVPCLSIFCATMKKQNIETRELRVRRNEKSLSERKTKTMTAHVMNNPQALTEDEWSATHANTVLAVPRRWWPFIFFYNWLIDGTIETKLRLHHSFFTKRILSYMVGKRNRISSVYSRKSFHFPFDLNQCKFALMISAEI